jgi:hypothetical protein
MSIKQRPVITMTERVKCAQCGKDAIGFPSIGCSFMNVCEEHADSHIAALEAR